MEKTTKIVSNKTLALYGSNFNHRGMHMRKIPLVFTYLQTLILGINFCNKGNFEIFNWFSVVNKMN